MSLRRASSLARRKPTRAPRKRFVIFCEGENTEPAYFAAMREMCKDALIEIQTENGKGVPFTLATLAVEKINKMGLGRKKRSLNSFEENDEVWTVFDRDEHPKYLDAIDLCEKNGVGVGRSDPCFELWLILHFQEFDKFVGRHEVQAHLEKICLEYSKEKGKKPDCNKLIPALAAAEERAYRQLKRREKEGSELGAPSTTVFKLTSAIKKAINASKKPTP